MDGVYNLLTNLDPTKQQDQMVFPQNYLRKPHHKWLHYLLSFSKLHLIRENCHLTGNLPTLHPYIKKADPSNYRSISLTSICSHVINSSIFLHLEQAKQVNFWVFDSYSPLTNTQALAINFIC